MDPERQREIARLGGQAAHTQGTAHQFTADEAREAGRRGGTRISQDREHMASIGRRGGHTVSQDRQRMAELGRLGGATRAERRAASAGNGSARLDGYEDGAATREAS
jgi:general stress protein YciG